MTGKGLLVLLGLGAGAAYLYSRRDESDGSTTDVMPSPPGGDSSAWPPPDDILAKYQAIIYGHGTDNDCKDVLEYIDHLQGENAAEDQWIADRRAEVVMACEAGPIDVVNRSPGYFPSTFQPTFDISALPWDIIPENVATGINECFTGTCDPSFANAVSQNLDRLADYYHGMIPTADEQQLRFASDALGQKYGFATAGIHVGDCGCQACKEKRVGQEEPCCEACAKGVGSCACQMQYDERIEELPQVRGT